MTAETGREDTKPWLIDKSALARLGSSAQAGEWALRIERGLVRISTVTLLEVGYSARSARDLRAGLRSPPISAMPVEYLTPAIEDVLTRCSPRSPTVDTIVRRRTRSPHRGHRRALGLIVLHLDKEFEVIAEITGQPVQRLVVPGT